MKIKPDFIRFGFISVLGVALDLTVAQSLNVLTSLSLTWCAIFGFVTGLVVNYLCHICWTFKDSYHTTPRPNWTTFSRYFVAMLLVLGSRIGVIYILSPWFSAPSQHFILLVIACGISFNINYILSKYILNNNV